MRVSMSVEDFFSKEGIKKFKNGAKKFAENQATRFLATTMLLSGAFCGMQAASSGSQQQETSSNDQAKVYVIHQNDTLCSLNVASKDTADIARIQKVVSYASQTTQGREVLQNASKIGTTLSMEHSDMAAIGYFTPDNNSMAMNAKCTDAQLCSNVIHELEHAGQHNRLLKTFGKVSEYKYNVADVIMLERAKEADAIAVQANHSYQLLQQGDSIVWNAFAQNHPTVAQGYMQAVGKYASISNDQARNDSIMKAANLSSYEDYDYVGKYDAKFINYMGSVLSKNDGAKLAKAGMSKTSLDASKMMVAMCSGSGHSYMGTDGSILKTPQTFYLSEGCQMKALNFEIATETKLGYADASANNMYVLADGQIKTMTYNQENGVLAPVKATSLQSKLNSQQTHNTLQNSLQKTIVAQNGGASR